VHVGPRGRIGEGAHDMSGRADLRIAAPEVDELVAFSRGSDCDSREQRGEVLLGETTYPIRGFAHPATLRGGCLRST
jgi:hypothetical protein